MENAIPCFHQKHLFPSDSARFKDELMEVRKTRMRQIDRKIRDRDRGWLKEIEKKC